MFWLKVILYSMVLALAGCGGDSAPNNDNPGGSGGGGTEVTPPTIPPSSKSIRATDFNKKVTVNSNVEQVNVNLSIFVSSLSSEKITLEAVEPVSKSALCQVLDVNETMLQFSISPNNATGCIYKYTVSNDSEFASGYANIVVSAPSNSLQNRTKAMTSSELPPLEHNMVLDESLSINLVNDGVVDTSGMTHPLFSESVITYGNGNAVLQENGQFDYKAISTGSTFISYYILDDMNTFSPDDDIVYQGNITINVSGSDNTPPTTVKVEDLSPVVIGAGESTDIDILAYPTDSGKISLINDVDSDELQLIFVNAENIDAYIETVDLNNVKNTTFKIKGLSKGSYLIDYVIYDHNKNGIAHGKIPINVTDTLTGKIGFFLEGYIKLFKDGTLGVVPNSSSYNLPEIIKNANEQLTEKGLEATEILNVGMGLFWVKTDNPVYSLIIGTQRSDLLENVKVVYGNSFSANRSDSENIVLLHFNDKHVESYAQIYYMNSNLIPTVVEQFNALPLEERSNIERLVRFNYSLIAFYYTDGRARVLAISYDYPTDTAKSIWLDSSLDSDLVNFSSCLLSKSGQEAQKYTKLGVDAATILFTDNTTCSYAKLPSISDHFAQLSNINETSSVVDIKHLSLNSSPTALLTENNELFVANNYFEPWKKVSDNVTNFDVNGSLVVYRTTDKNIHLYRNKRCVKFMSISPPSETSSPDCSEGADISPNLNLLPKNYGQDVKFYKLTSDVIGLLYNDGSLAFISARGYQKVDGNYAWLIGDKNKASAGNYFDRASWYQGNNLFAAYNLSTSQWEIFNPLEGWNGEFQCSFDPSLLKSEENVVDIFIMNGIYPLDGSTQPCPIYIFKDNGTQMNEALNTYAYPKDKFDDNPFFLPLMDIDGDGMSNDLEKNQCKSSQSLIDKTHHSDWCSSPALADSDFDDVADRFENEYSSEGHLRYLSDSSHLMFEPLSLAPKDAYKDINGNGLADWLEE
ncbi:TPA: hypothetical protein NGU92_004446 [Vibrio parahaemolyticus]|nr:hypothetical protein [Vibrio parahaemolyticus]